MLIFYMILWCHFEAICLTLITGKEKVMKKLYIDLDRKSETLLKQQLSKQVNDAHTQSEISFPILGQSMQT